MDEKELEKRIKALDKRRGNNLRRLRDQKGWSQDELSKKTGIGQTKISAYENGLGFDKETLIRLCAAFNVKEWEFEWEESIPVIKDYAEAEDIKRRREADRLGIGVMVREAEAGWIASAKKKGPTGSEGTKSGVPRRRNKRAG
jgi:transcriptional regulator with XRE-family HTH domain